MMRMMMTSHKLQLYKVQNESEFISALSFGSLSLCRRLQRWLSVGYFICQLISILVISDVDTSSSFIFFFCLEKFVIYSFFCLLANQYIFYGTKKRNAQQLKDGKKAIFFFVSQCITKLFFEESSRRRKKPNS